MNRLDKASESQFDKIIESINQNTRLTSEAFDKLLVALTGTFRLLDGEQTVLSTLQGNPEEVKAYVITLLGQIRSMVTDGYATLKKDILDIAGELEKANM